MNKQEPKDEDYIGIGGNGTPPPWEDEELKPPIGPTYDGEYEWS